jgi:hypothetical protein
MKKLLVLFLTVVCGQLTVDSFSQNGVSINTTGAEADNSAILDISSTSQGLLIPRMTTEQRNNINAPATSLLIFNTTINCFEAYVNNAWYSVSCSPPCTLPDAPSAGTGVPYPSQIAWSWNSVSGATGYKWSTGNNFTNAVDNGTSVSYTQNGLTSNTSYTIYVWSYNACGNSSTYLNLSQTTISYSCTSLFTVSYTPGVNGVPSNSPATITYGSTDYYRTQTGVCWLTQSLGATQQPTSLFDPRSAASGWYFQFNRSQAYSMADDGVTITPSSGWTSTSTLYPSGWTSDNDPCIIQLGSGWRLPTWAEYYPLPWNWNHDNCGANSSPLAIAGSGYIDLTSSTAHLHLRPSTSCDLSTAIDHGNYNTGAPFYWSSSPYNGIGIFWVPGWTYPGNYNWSYINNAYALPVRCVHP